MESDDEVKGQGNSYTTEYRQYDPRIARWTSLDPEFMNFPWQSPYAAFDNNPIINNDPKGGAAENQTGGPGKRKQKLALKKSKALDLERMMKFNRLERRLRRLTKGTKGQFKGNRNMSLHKLFNFGKGGSEAKGDSYSISDTEEARPEREAGSMNRIGFKIVKIDPYGKVDVIPLGGPSPTNSQVPVWKENPYGEEVDSPIQIGDDGSILDKSRQNVLIPIPKGVDINDGLYQKGDELNNGRRATEDSVIRKEGVTVKDKNGTSKGFSSRRKNITKKVERLNK